MKYKYQISEQGNIMLLLISDAIRDFQTQYQENHIGKEFKTRIYQETSKHNDKWLTEHILEVKIIE